MAAERRLSAAAAGSTELTRAATAVLGGAKARLVQEGDGRRGAAGGVGVSRLAPGGGPRDGWRHGLAVQDAAVEAR
jgi:hypothetical protein